jgi:hypothetical protein
LERAKQVLTRAANACAAAEQVLPARSQLQRDVAAAGSEIAALRLQSQALGAELAAEEARGAAASAAARKARERLRQLAASASELLAFAGEAPRGAGADGGEGEAADARALLAALEAWALKRLVARGVVELAPAGAGPLEGGGRAP